MLRKHLDAMIKRSERHFRSATVRFGVLALMSTFTFPVHVLAQTADAISPLLEGGARDQLSAGTGVDDPRRPRPKEPRGQIRNIADKTLRAAADAEPVKTVASDAFTGPPGPYGERLTFDSKGITLQFPDDAAKLRIGGRLQLDYGAAGVRQRDFGDPFDRTFDVRRSWLETFLTLKGGFEFAFQYDFSNANTPIYDALVAYRGLDPFIITVGNMKEPFFLDRMTNNNDLLFTERALPDAFNPSRSFGAAIGSNGERWTLTAGVYGNNANNGITDNGVAGVARATYAPILRKDEVLHLAVAGAYRSLDRRGPDLSFSSQPEAFLFSEKKQFVDTDTIDDASTTRRLGLEAAYQYGPVLVQAEYVRTDVDRFGGLPSLTFQGGYVQAGWILNGSGRAYKLKPDYGTTYARWGGVEVEEGQRVTRGGIGVFELGVRFSAIDLQDRTVRGGIEHDVTVGLNWYPEKNVKVMADYVRTHADPSVARNGRPADADIFIGRLQFYW